MTARVLGALLVLCIVGCRPSPAPSPPPDFFEPGGGATNQGASDTAVPDFSWWFGERKVVVHPISTSTDDEFWYAWRFREYRLGSSGTATREEVREAHLRFLNTPGIFGTLTPSRDESDGRAEAHSVPLDRFALDAWIALGSPFDHDVVHVFQTPVYIGPDLPANAAQVTYLTEHFVFTATPRVVVDVIFAPDAVRAGQTGIIPAPYASLLQSTSGRLIYPIEVTFLYPTYREAIVTDYAIVSEGDDLTRWFYPRDAEYLQQRQEVTDE